MPVPILASIRKTYKTRVWTEKWTVSPSPPSLSKPFLHKHPLKASTLMCHWRRVRNHFKRCTHYVDLPDEMIQCDDRFCKFSTCHPRNCVPPRCTETCWQYRQFPQQFNPVIDDFCPSCIQMGRGQPTANASKYA